MNKEHNTIKQLLEIPKVLSVTVLQQWKKWWNKYISTQGHGYDKTSVYRMLGFTDSVSIPANHVSYNNSSFYTCSIEFLHDDILKIRIPFSTKLIFANINIQQNKPQNFGCKFLWVGESSYNGEQHTFGFNFQYFVTAPL